MKKVILAVACGALLMVACKKKQECEKSKCDTKETEVVAHNSENSLDWAGTYEGTLPCADCEGIKTWIALDDDYTFEKKQEYLGRENAVSETKGSFSWDKTGSIITLKFEDGDAECYKVGEGALMMLDAEGNIIEGDLADAYVLKK